MVEKRSYAYGFLRKGVFVSLLVACGLLLPSSQSHAYVNPGLGGQLFQIGFVFFYAILGCLTFLFRPITRLFKKKDKAKAGEKQNENTSR